MNHDASPACHPAKHRISRTWSVSHQQMAGWSGLHMLEGAALTALTYRIMHFSEVNIAILKSGKCDGLHRQLSRDAHAPTQTRTQYVYSTVHQSTQPREPSLSEFPTSKYTSCLYREPCLRPCTISNGLSFSCLRGRRARDGYGTWTSRA